MSNEDQMWDYTRPRLAPYGRWVRIENNIPTELGTPDCHYTLTMTGLSFSGWMELKHLDSPPVGASTPLLIPTLTLDQVLWQEEEHGAGGRMFTLLRVGRAFALMRPNVVRGIYERRVTFHALKQEARYFSAVSFQPSELVRCLKHR